MGGDKMLKNQPKLVYALIPVVLILLVVAIVVAFKDGPEEQDPQEENQMNEEEVDMAVDALFLEREDTYQGIVD